MTPQRVAYVVNVFPKLSETFIAGELVELRKRGVELRVLSLRRPTETLRHDFIAQAGLDRIVSYEPAESRSVLREFQPQLLHAHFATEPTAAAREWAAELGVPFTFTAHGYDIRRKPPPDFAERAAAAGALITVSQANARHIAQTFGVSMDRMKIIPCGVDTDRFCLLTTKGNPEVVPRPPTEDQAPLVVCVARHVAVKNLGRLLDAFALLRDRGVKFQGVLIGDGPLRGELELKHAKLNLNGIVKFVGAQAQEQVLNGWQRARVAVLSSDQEGMPVCLMEAAACGVPAVAPAVGGIPELVEDGISGLLVPPGVAEGLATAIERLLSEPALATQMGAAARRRVEKQFSVKRQIDQLLGVWSEVLKRRP
jgi:colanic acid/amylovoran biosynthesis glycosyltransferase